MFKIKTRPLSRCTRPVKTNRMIGVLNTILLQLDLKVMRQRSSEYATNYTIN